MIRFIANLFFYSSLFCYVTPVNIFPTDIQPFYLVFGVIYILIRFPNKLPKEISVIIFTVIVSSFILVVNLFTFDAIRSYLAYLGILVCFVAYYKYLIDYGIPYKIFENFVYIIFAISLAQKFISKNLFSFFLVSQRTSDERGVTSVFSEPTHYGMICLFLIIILLLIDHPLKKRLNWILLIQIFVLAMSTQTMLFVFLWAIIYIILNKLKLSQSFIIVAMLAIISYSYSFFVVYFDLVDIRFVKLLDVIINDGFEMLIVADSSVADRLAHIIYSFKGFYDNYFLPNGFVYWFDYLDYNNNMFEGTLPHAGMSKIMSSFGAVLFELGIFGLPLILLFYFNIIRLSKKANRNSLEIVIVFSFIFLTAVQLTLPLYSFILGFGCWARATKFL